MMMRRMIKALAAATLYVTICGVPIAREGETDWYKYIRVKYCPVCREDVHRQQKAASKRRTRQAVRKAKKEARARAIAAKAENDQLRALLRENRQMAWMLDRETKEETHDTKRI